MNLELAKEAYLKCCKSEKRLSECTIKAYSIDLQQFVKYCEAEVNRGNIITADDVSSIDKTFLRTYLSKLNEQYKPKSTKRKIATLKGFFAFLEEEEIIEISPFCNLKIKLKEAKTLPTTMTIKEVRKVLKAVYNRQSGTKKSEELSVMEFVHLRDIAVIEMLFATGMRVHELCGLTFASYNTKRHSIDIIGKGQRERRLFIGNPEVIKAINNYLAYARKLGFKSNYIFLNKRGEPLSCQAVRNIVSKYCALARIDKNITPHVFRHSFASLLLEEGVDIKYIQEFLGHSTIATTQIYLHISEKNARRVLENKHPRKNVLIYQTEE